MRFLSQGSTLNKKKKIIAQHKLKRLFERTSVKKKKGKNLKSQTYLDNALATKKKRNKDIQLSSSAR